MARNPAVRIAGAGARVSAAARPVRGAAGHFRRKTKLVYVRTTSTKQWKVHVLSCPALRCCFLMRRVMGWAGQLTRSGRKPKCSGFREKHGRDPGASCDGRSHSSNNIFLEKMTDRQIIGIQIWLVALRKIADTNSSFPTKIGILEDL